MTISYHFKNYLTEQSLGEFLKFVFGGKVTSQVKIDKRMSCDYCIAGLNGKLYIEFDGPYHYTSPVCAVNDDRKKVLIQENPLNNIIRIPYFIQIDSTIWKSLFVPYLRFAGLQDYEKINITTDWEHGFISKKIVYPASYCSLGVNRFKDELRQFDKILNNKIFYSLCEAAKKLGNNNLVFHHERG